MELFFSRYMYVRSPHFAQYVLTHTANLKYQGNLKMIFEIKKAARKNAARRKNQCVEAEP